MGAFLHAPCGSQACQCAAPVTCPETPPTAAPARCCRAAQGALWALLFRLTYWELSWDVMEPVCFFVGGGQAMVRAGRGWRRGLLCAARR